MTANEELHGHPVLAKQLNLGHCGGLGMLAEWRMQGEYIQNTEAKTRRETDGWNNEKMEK
jgi:hypothetical protein